MCSLGVLCSCGRFFLNRRRGRGRPRIILAQLDGGVAPLHARSPRLQIIERQRMHLNGKTTTKIGGNVLHGDRTDVFCKRHYVAAHRATRDIARAVEARSSLPSTTWP